MIQVIEVRDLIIQLSSVHDGKKYFMTPEELNSFCKPMWIKDNPLDAWCDRCCDTAAVINPMGEIVCMSCGGRIPPNNALARGTLGAVWN